MKKIAKYMFALCVAGSFTAGSLYAQDDDYFEPSDTAAEQGLEMSFGNYLGWTKAGLAIGGMAAVGALSNGYTSHPGAKLPSN